MHLSNAIFAVFHVWFLSLQNDSTDATVTGISFEGCFWNLTHYTTRLSLSNNNDPRHCFQECNNTDYIGLQKQDCFCAATRGAFATERDCSYVCPGDGRFMCGSNNHIYMYYYRDQPTINVYGEFGFLYLHIFHVPGVVSYRYEIYGTNSITEVHQYICYDDPTKCQFTSPGVEKTWQDAKSECLVHNQGLVPFRIAMDENICAPKFPEGFFWIGMPWFTPVSTTTTTNGLRINHTSDTLKTTEDSSSDGINVIAVAVSVAGIAVAILALVVLIWIYKKGKLCFRNQNDSDNTEETNSDSTPPIPAIITSSSPASVPPGSTQM